ncbi:MAG TPA: hypothetical protein VKK79_12255 [Candidatus Lokiarchaeia archaeon]|nr:hypothetical protein [Candidatus Lokiarchaeia archaeon]
MADVVTYWIIFITLLIIYGLTLCWDLLKREEPYGNFAYITALLPANFLWFAIQDSLGSGNSFNALGAAAFLMTLWFLAMVRDIATTRSKKKDLDDVVLYLLVGIIIQLILYAVMPANGVLPALNENAAGATSTFWSFWIMPNINWTGYPALIVLWFRLVTTALLAGVIIPMIMDLKGTPVHPGVLIVIAALFMIPFAFLAYIWVPDTTGTWVAILFMLMVLFVILLLSLARSPTTKSTPPSKK